MMNYVQIMDEERWGSLTVATAEEYDAACERMEDWLTEHEGDEISISVCMASRGEASGLYLETASGNLQILGYSLEIPDEIRDLTDQAWEHACRTWE